MPRGWVVFCDGAQGVVGEAIIRGSRLAFRGKWPGQGLVGFWAETNGFGLFGFG